MQKIEWFEEPELEWIFIRENNQQIDIEFLRGVILGIVEDEYIFLNVNNNRLNLLYLLKDSYESYNGFDLYDTNFKHFRIKTYDTYESIMEKFERKRYFHKYISKDIFPEIALQIVGYLLEPSHQTVPFVSTEEMDMLYETENKIKEGVNEDELYY